MSKTPEQKFFEDALNIGSYEPNKIYHAINGNEDKIRPDYKNGRGHTALKLAIHHNDVPVVKKLLEMGASTSKDILGENILLMAWNKSDTVKGEILRHLNNKELHAELFEIRYRSNDAFNRINILMAGHFNSNSQKHDAFLKEELNIISKKKFIDMGRTAITESFDFESEQVFIKTETLLPKKNDYEGNHVVHKIKTFDEYPERYLVKAAKSLIEQGGDDCGFAEMIAEENLKTAPKANKTQAFAGKLGSKRRLP